MLPIYIPTRSRWQRCLTLDQLGPLALRRPVYLVVPEEQRHQYIELSAASTQAWGCRVPVLAPPGVKGIAATRQFIGRHAAAYTHAHKKFIMLDDDLRFVRRKSKDDWHLQPNKPMDHVMMLAKVEAYLDKYAHVGISARQANNQMDLPAEYSVRCIRALAYRTHEFNRCVHGRVNIMEDFDVTLQLLAKGYPNAVLTYWAQDQAQTQAKGGCSDYRSHKLHENNVRKMAALWGDGIVRLRQKQNKTGGEFGSRLEATIYWKKALGLYERELL